MRYATIAINKSLRIAIEIMAHEDLNVLPVISDLIKDEVVSLFSYKAFYQHTTQNLMSMKEQMPVFHLKIMVLKFYCMDKNC
jgi:hypothetical protein